MRSLVYICNINISKSNFSELTSWDQGYNPTRWSLDLCSDHGLTFILDCVVKRLTVSLGISISSFKFPFST